MKEITPFPDQIKWIDEIKSAMRSSKAICAVAQTGFGKTLSSAHMMTKICEKGNTAWFMVPRRELLKQTCKSLNEYGINYGIISSGYTSNPFARINVCTSGTLNNRIKKGLVKPPTVLFHDEAHFSGGQIDDIIDWARDAGSWRIGLTATPERLDGKGLDRHYDTMVEGPSLAWLIKNKRLSDFRYFAPSTPDMTGIRKSNGDYSTKQMEEKFSQDRVRIGDAVKHYKEHAYGKKHLCFCVSVKDAEKVAEGFRDRGISCLAVYGELGDAEITKRIIAFARGEVMALTSVNLMSFGFDLASAAGMPVTIESLGMMRPSDSLALVLQMWGRGLRMKDQPCYIFDHAGLASKHGLPDDERRWTLAGREKRSGGNQKTEPTRQCETCYFVHRPSPCCPNCGFVYPIKSREVEEIEGELMEVSRDQQKQEAKEMRMAQGMAKTYSELVAHFVLKGSKNPHYQAKMIMDARRRKHA